MYTVDEALEEKAARYWVKFVYYLCKHFALLAYRCASWQVKTARAGRYQASIRRRNIENRVQRISRLVILLSDHHYSLYSHLVWIHTNNRLTATTSIWSMVVIWKYFLPVMDTIAQTSTKKFLPMDRYNQCQARMIVLIDTIGIGPWITWSKIKAFFLVNGKKREKLYFLGPLLE